MEFAQDTVDPWQPNDSSLSVLDLKLETLSKEPFYGDLISELETDGLVDLNKAQKIFDLACIPHQTLETVKNICLINKRDKTTKSNFCLILILIAFSQKNYSPSMELVLKNIDDLPMPIFPVNPTVSSLSLRQQPQLNSTQTQLASNTEKFVYTITEAGSEGIILFKHMTYKIDSKKDQSGVIRRYSDFYWLYEYLVKQYPCRLIYPMPPKRINPSREFLHRRNLGLTRFINHIANHPILNKDIIFKSFLTQNLDSNLSWHREQAYSPDSLNEIQEHIDKSISSHLENISQSQEVEIEFAEEKQRSLNLRDLLTKQINMLSAYKNYTKISSKILMDLTLISNVKKEESYSSTETLLSPQSTTPRNVNKYPVLSHEQYPKLFLQIKDAATIKKNYATVIEIEIIENLKYQRDITQSFIELLERREFELKGNAQNLAKKIEQHKKDLVALNQEQILNHEQIKHTKNLIEQDKKAILMNQLKSAYVYKCICEESELYYSEFYNRNAEVFEAVRKENVSFAKSWLDIWRVEK